MFRDVLHCSLKVYLRHGALWPRRGWPLGALSRSISHSLLYLSEDSERATRHFNFRSLIIVTPLTFVYNYARSDRIKWASSLRERERKRKGSISCDINGSMWENEQTLAWKPKEKAFDRSVIFSSCFRSLGLLIDAAAHTKESAHHISTSLLIFHLLIRVFKSC